MIERTKIERKNDIKCILKHFDWINDEKKCLEKVKEDGDALRYVKNQTEEICLEAVKQNGYALRYVDYIFLKKWLKS